MNRTQLIKLIHIGKKQLGLDDSTYRAMLQNIGGDDSCKTCSHRGLERIYDHMKTLGFEFKANPNKAKRVPLDSKGRAKLNEIQKIRAIWITMHQEGFVKNGSEHALDVYVKRMTTKLNNGLGVETVGWLDYELAVKVLEALKNWHRRLMCAAMGKKTTDLDSGDYYYDGVCRYYRFYLKQKRYLVWLKEAQEKNISLLRYFCPLCGSCYETEQAEVGGSYRAVTECLYRKCGIEFIKIVMHNYARGEEREL